MRNFKEDKMKLKKKLLTLGLIICLTWGLTLGLAANDCEIKRGTHMYGAYMVSYPGLWLPLKTLGIQGEYFLNRAISFNADVLLLGGLVGLPSLELAFHAFPFDRGGAGKGSLELMAGGGATFLIGYDGGVCVTAFGGARYYLSKRVGLFAKARYFFAGMNLMEPAGPLLSLGLSYKLK